MIEVKVKFDDKDYVIKPTIALIASIEGTFGSITEYIGKISDGKATITSMVECTEKLLSGCPNAPNKEEILRVIFSKGISEAVNVIGNFATRGLVGEVTRMPKGEEVAQNPNQTG